MALDGDQADVDDGELVQMEKVMVEKVTNEREPVMDGVCLALQSQGNAVMEDLALTPVLSGVWCM